MFLIHFCMFLMDFGMLLIYAGLFLIDFDLQNPSKTVPFALILVLQAAGGPIRPFF